MFAYGQFDTASSVYSKSIARWDGESWHSFAQPINGEVFTAVTINDKLYIGGSFDTIAGENHKSIAIWDGVNWYNPLENFENYQDIQRIVDIVFLNDEIIVRGDYWSNINGSRSFFLKLYGDDDWDIIEQPPLGNWINCCDKMYVRNNQLLVSGRTLLPGESARDDIYYLSDNQWLIHSENLRGEFAEFNEDLFLYGNESLYIYDSLANNWTEIAPFWNNLEFNMNGYVYASQIFGDELYLGGFFDNITNFSVPSPYLIKIKPQSSGIKEVKESEFFIYPNPSDGDVNIRFTNESNIEYHLLVTDITGKTVFTDKITTSHYTLDGFQLKSGIYLLRIYNDEKMFVQKVMKK